jgi:hypothetical protein
MSIWDAPDVAVSRAGEAVLTVATAPPPPSVIPAGAASARTDVARVTPPLDFSAESRLIRLARELAMEMRSVDQILADYGVGPPEWERLQRSPWFQQTMTAEMAQWNAAGSTHDRVRVKSAVLVEEYLVEANARLRDPEETLSSKVELFKTLARIANLGTGDGEASGGGFRVVINIAGAPQVNRTINVAKQVTDIEDVAVEREQAIRHEAERKQESVVLPDGGLAHSAAMPRITIRDATSPTGVLTTAFDPPTVAGRPPPSERPPAELSARSLMSRSRR